MNLLEHVEGFVNGKVNVLKIYLSLIKLEARLARLSIYPLILTFCFLIVVLMSGWFSILALIGYFLMLTLKSTVPTLLIILMINLMCLLLITRSISYNVKNMSFAKTRESLFRITEENNDEPAQ